VNWKTTVIVAAFAIAATGLAFSATAQPPGTPTESLQDGSGPDGAEFPEGVRRKEVYYPTMSLGHRPGTYLTVEGVSGHEAKGGQPFVVIDTVNGRRLDKSIAIPIRNATIADNARCILKGYETGEMTGEPPAVREAAKEEGKEIPPSASAWRWQTHFVVLIAVKPENTVNDK
jgi:hypothetical protein